MQETCYDLMEVVDPVNEHEELQYLCFHCSIPNLSGRGFIEVLSLFVFSDHVLFFFHCKICLDIVNY